MYTFWHSHIWECKLQHRSSQRQLFSILQSVKYLYNLYETKDEVLLVIMSSYSKLLNEHFLDIKSLIRRIWWNTILSINIVILIKIESLGFNISFNQTETFCIQKWFSFYKYRFASLWQFHYFIHPVDEYKDINYISSWMWSWNTINEE